MGSKASCTIRTFSLNLLLLTALLAQPFSKFQVGLQAGTNLSHISGATRIFERNLTEPHKNPGLNIGIILAKPIDSRTTMQIDIGYNEVGSQWGRPLWSLSYDGDYAIYELKYLNISGYYKLRSRVGNLLRDFDLVFGGYYGYNIAARQKWVVEVYDYVFDAGPPDIRKQIRHHEFGVVYGIKIPFRHRQFFFSLLFRRALSPLYSRIYPQYKDDFRNKNKMHNHSLAISLEWFWWLPGRQ